MRGAAEDLSGYDGFDTVCQNFNQNSLTAFQYQGGVYALPETMSFPMLFYRKDILQKLGIDINDIKTWDDVIKILPVIQSNNMNFGLPAFSSVTVSTAPNTYFMFLYQNGGQIYKDGGKAINLDDKVSLERFIIICASIPVTDCRLFTILKRASVPVKYRSAYPIIPPITCCRFLRRRYRGCGE